MYSEVATPRIHDKACTDLQYVCVCVAEAGQKVLGQTVESKGERTNCCTNVSLGEKVSEVPRRSGDTCAILLSSILCFPIPPHITAFPSSPFLSLFTLLRVQRCGSFDFDSSLLITDVPVWPCVCVFAMRRGQISLQRYEVSKMHTHSDKLIDE